MRFLCWGDGNGAAFPRADEVSDRGSLASREKEATAVSRLADKVGEFLAWSACIVGFLLVILYF